MKLYSRKVGKFQAVSKRKQRSMERKQQKKDRSLERAMYTSLLSVVLCCVYLLGTTFAWYTASVSTQPEKIQTGSLSVAIVSEDAEASENSAQLRFTSYRRNGTETAITDENRESVRWQPGDTFALEPFCVANTGEIDLKYTLCVDLGEAVVTGGDNAAKEALLRTLTFEISAKNADGTFEKLNWTKCPDDESGRYILLPSQNTIPAKQPDATASTCSGYYQITVTLPTDANSALMGLTLKGVKITANVVQDSAMIPGEFTQVSDGATLREAVIGGGYVILTQDVALSGTLTIPQDKTVTLDLNGYKLTNACIENFGTLTVLGGTAVNSGDVLINRGTLKILSGTYRNEGNSGAVIRTYTGSCTISGGTFDLPNATYALSCEGGKTVITGGVFREVKSHFLYAATGAKVAISGGRLSGEINVVTDAEPQAKLTITGGEFSTDPTAYVDATGYTVTLNGTTWTVAAK